MADLQKRLFGPAQLTNVTATKYTVPANRRAIIRHMHFFNADTVARTVTVSIGSDAAGTRIYDAFSIGTGQPFDHFPMYVLEAAEILAANADVTLKVTLTVDGIEQLVS